MYLGPCSMISKYTWELNLKSKIIGKYLVSKYYIILLIEIYIYFYLFKMKIDAYLSRLLVPTCDF